MAYGYVSLAQAKTELAQRLADPNGTFWSAAERGMYIVEALRVRNALTSEWVQDFAITAPLAANQVWYRLDQIANSPRLRTVTDTDIYKLMEYHLLEPATGGTWTGSSQFSISDLSAALQRRRDELLQAAMCNVNLSSQAASLQRRNTLADTALELRRLRFVPTIGDIDSLGWLFGAAPTIPPGSYEVMVVEYSGVTPTTVTQGSVVTGVPGPNQAIDIITTVTNPFTAVRWKIYASQDGWITTYVWTFTGPLGVPGVNLNFGDAVTTTGRPSLPDYVAPSTLQQSDNLASEYFNDDYGQTTGVPETWSVVTESPLTFDVDFAPSVPGAYEMLTLDAGAAFVPPAATLLGIPDDFAWVAKWGALADLLGRESEATDRARAAYCLQRYQDGLKLLANSPWLLLAKRNSIPIGTPTVEDMDIYGIEWDSRPDADEVLVVAGIDCFALSPVPVSPQVGILVTVVGNAPVPTADGDFIQVGRDAYDVILDYAQALAMFKMGGQEFSDSAGLTKNFIESAKRDNARLEALGLFRDVLLQDRQAERTEA